MAIDDCEFICNLAKHLQSTYNLSEKNTFLTGMSNGGEMCYLMAYRKPEAFGAIASMAGLTLVEMAKRHNYTKPVAFMEVHGTGDTTSRWVGDPTNQYGWGAYLAVPLAVEAVAAANKCMYQETKEIATKANRIQLHRYYGSPSGKEVHFYEVTNGGHNWATDSFDSCKVIMEFFKKNMAK
jgi:polyhydroxybutyrate depolymerase